MTVDLLIANPLVLKNDPVETRVMEPYFPLGPLYVASAVRQGGYSVEVFDALLGDGPEDFSNALGTYLPKVVGISTLNTTRAMALKFARIAHEHGSAVVFGGPDVTARPESYLFPGGDEVGTADAAVLGEGEAAMRDLMHTLLEYWPARPDSEDLEQIPGIAYPSANGVVQRTASRRLLMELDSLPFPDRDYVDIDAYRELWESKHGDFSLSIITTRGCPYECTWCAKPVFERAYNMRSPGDVVREMLHIKEKYAPDRVRICDDIFGLNRRWLAEWRELVVAHDAVIPYDCLSRVDLFTEKTAPLFAASGCRRICFGVESGSQRVLDEMKKKTKVEQIYAATDLARKLGIEVYFFIMLGYLGETHEDVQLTRKMLLKALPDEFSVSVAYPLAGTEFYDTVADRLLSDHDWRHSGENRVLHGYAKYRTSYYRWVERLMQKEVEIARLRLRNKFSIRRHLPLLLKKWVSWTAAQAWRRIPPRRVQSTKHVTRTAVSPGSQGTVE